MATKKIAEWEREAIGTYLSENRAYRPNERGIWLIARYTPPSIIIERVTTVPYFEGRFIDAVACAVQKYGGHINTSSYNVQKIAPVKAKERPELDKLVRDLSRKK